MTPWGAKLLTCWQVLPLVAEWACCCQWTGSSSLSPGPETPPPLIETVSLKQHQMLHKSVLTKVVIAKNRWGVGGETDREGETERPATKLKMAWDQGNVQPEHSSHSLFSPHSFLTFSNRQYPNPNIYSAPPESNFNFHNLQHFSPSVLYSPVIILQPTSQLLRPFSSLCNKTSQNIYFTKS